MFVRDVSLPGAEIRSERRFVSGFLLANNRRLHVPVPDRRVFSMKAGTSIVVVDDDSVDQMLLRRAFKHAGVTNPVFTASDGEKGLALLKGNAGSPTVPKPRLVLLDLNMPRMNGHEFLDSIRGDEDLRDTTVFVLTTSTDTRDVQQAYARQVAGYIAKEDAGLKYEALLELLDSYLDVVALPS